MLEAINTLHSEKESLPWMLVIHAGAELKRDKTKEFRYGSLMGR